MNVTKFLFCCLFCAVIAFAQQPSEEKSSNTLRGFAYNPYGTLGAAPTIADILQKPSNIYEYKFVYVDPASSSGYSAFDLAGGSALLGFDRSLILGFAKSFYGLSLSIYPHWTCFNNDGYKCTEYYDISDIGLNFSMPLGSLILYAYAGKIIARTEWANWLTTYEENNEQNSVYKSHESIKKAHIGIIGGNALAWNLMLSFDYANSTYSEIFREGHDAKFLFDFGYKFLQSDMVKFIAGLNNGLFWQQHYSNNSNFNTDYLYIDIFPNFLGEVVLTKHLLAFIGAKYGINFGMKLSDDSYSEMIIRNSDSKAYVGLRYERENWAVEARLQSDVFGEVLDGNNPFISLGGFIWLAL